MPDEEQTPTCDRRTKPTHTPGGASPFGFWDCDHATMQWFWNDPQIAEDDA